jgi:hypothetical protein
MWINWWKYNWNIIGGREKWENKKWNVRIEKWIKWKLWNELK